MENVNRWYFTKDQLANTPSRKHNIDVNKELSYRQQASHFIQDMGQRLAVSQLCINTAIVYMHRFYVFHSFSEVHRNGISVAALYLAAKVEEQPRKLEHVIKIAHLCLHKDGLHLDVRSDAYAEKQLEVVAHENVLLQALGFVLAIEHPHTYVVKVCQLVKASKDLAQTSYFMATTSLHMTTMCLQYKPTVVACVCIHLACKWSNWKIEPCSEGKEWYYYVDKSVTLDLLESLTKEFIAIMETSPHRFKKRFISHKDGGYHGPKNILDEVTGKGHFSENKIGIARKDYSSPGTSSTISFNFNDFDEKPSDSDNSEKTPVTSSQSSPNKKIKLDTPHSISIESYREKRQLKERRQSERKTISSIYTETLKDSTKKKDSEKTMVTLSDKERDRHHRTQSAKHHDETNLHVHRSAMSKDKSKVNSTKDSLNPLAQSTQKVNHQVLPKMNPESNKDLRHSSSSVELKNLSKFEAKKSSNIEGKNSSNEVKNSSNIQGKNLSNVEVNNSHVEVKNPSNNVKSLPNVVKKSSCNLKSPDYFELKFSPDKKSSTDLNIDKLLNIDKKSSDVDVKHGSSIDTKSSSIDVKHSSNIDVKHPSNIDVKHSSNIDVKHSSNIDVKHSSNIDVKHSSNIDVKHSSNIDVKHSSNIDVKHSSNIDTKTSGIDMKSSSIDMKSSSIDMKSSSIDAKISSNVDMEISSNSDTKNGTIEMKNSCNTDIKNYSHDKIEKSPNVGLKNSSHSKSEKPSHVDIKNASYVKLESQSNLDTKNSKIPKINTDPFVLLTRVDEQAGKCLLPPSDSQYLEKKNLSQSSSSNLNEKHKIKSLLKKVSTLDNSSEILCDIKTTLRTPETNLVIKSKHQKHKVNLLHNNHSNTQQITQGDPLKLSPISDNVKTNGSKETNAVDNRLHCAVENNIEFMRTSDSSSSKHEKQKKMHKHKHSSSRDKTVNHVIVPPTDNLPASGGSIKITIPKDKLCLGGARSESSQKSHSSGKSSESSTKKSIKIKLPKPPEVALPAVPKPSPGLKIVLTKDKSGSGSYSTSHKSDRESRKRPAANQNLEHHSTKNSHSYTSAKPPKMSKLEAAAQYKSHHLDSGNANTIKQIKISRHHNKEMGGIKLPPSDSAQHNFVIPYGGGTQSYNYSYPYAATHGHVPSAKTNSHPPPLPPPLPPQPPPPPPE